MIVILLFVYTRFMTVASLVMSDEPKMSNRDFFINFENKKLGRRLSDSLVPFLGSAKNRYTDKYTEKSMP